MGLPSQCHYICVASTKYPNNQKESNPNNQKESTTPSFLPSSIVHVPASSPANDEGRKRERETLMDEGPSLTRAHEGMGLPSQCHYICVASTTDPNNLKESTTRKSKSRKIARALQQRAKREKIAVEKDEDMLKAGLSKELPAYVLLGLPFADTPEHGTQNIGDRLCALKSINSLLKVPLDIPDVRAYAKFRALRWSNGSTQCFVEAKNFCSQKLANANWDFMIEYLDTRRLIKAIRLKGIAANNESNKEVIQRQTEPLLLLMYHPAHGKYKACYHVAAVKDKMVFDCDLKEPVVLSSYKSISSITRVYVLRSAVE